ncbi:MAG: DNA polymerase [Patescibacteria group bacterium]
MDLKFDPNNPRFEYITDIEGANKALDVLEKASIIGVDVEGTGLDPHLEKLLLVQIGTEDTSYLFDPRALDLGKLERLKNLLENPKIIKLTHNGKFDYKFIKVQTGISMTNIYDTMLTEAILTAGVGRRLHSLQVLTQDYAQFVLKKDTRESFQSYTGPITDEQKSYSALDTLVLFPIFEGQTPKLKKEGMVNVAKLEFASTLVVGDMEIRGVHIDSDKWKQILKDLAKKRDEIAKNFQEMIRTYYRNGNQTDLFGAPVDAINMNSTTQLLDLFNNKLALDMPSTGAEILKTVNHPVAQVLAEYRGYEKLISAFGETLLAQVNRKTGRLHPDFMQMGTATGRFSCKDPNLQQIPRNSEEAPFRTCFTPEPGYKLVTADYSSIEMRILADLSGDEKMIDAFLNDLDMHSYTAALMFNKEYNKDFKKQYPDLRQAAKSIGFGLMYGMGPVGLAAQLKIEPKLAEEYMNLFFKSYPSVKGFLDRLSKDAVRNGWSSTPSGRKRWYTFPEKTDPEYRKKISSIERQAKNHPIQGTNADAMKYALVFLNERLRKENVDGSIVLTVHDEIVSEIRADQAEDWAKIQSEEMVRAGALFVKKVPVISEAFVSDVWEH